MSLWQVPDRQTMEFMNAFYQYWLRMRCPFQTPSRLPSWKCGIGLLTRMRGRFCIGRVR
ncbi:MAG: CHAT domain-containing protein [Saprospirales bacterium]|nr:CHAT domain-containing protein [Saprospirales bacterium]